MVVNLIMLFGAAVYFYYLWESYKGYRKDDDVKGYPRRDVSIVIAARNEEENLPELLLRLRNQSYPEDSYEVIIIDDDSSDSTDTILRRFAENWEGLKVLKVHNREKAVSKKKNALQQGIEEARGDFILLTDADCLPNTNWISSMLAGFGEDTDMVVGYSRTSHAKMNRVPSVHWYEHIDFVNMFAVAGGLIRSGKYFSCSGQNLAYRKSSWEKVGGFSKISHIISGDDVNLMQLFRQSGMKIKFNLNPGSFMFTSGIDSWKSLINQRTRWASNTWFQLQLNPEFFIYLMSVLIITFLPWVLLIINWKLGLTIILLRLILETGFLRFVYRIIHEPQHMLYSYPVWYVIQPIYILIVAVLGFFGMFSWKK